ncbi:hypothetical protein BUZ14_04180 [Staphylococcus gallinarum]|uniref:DUF4889 domain-containing protein n=1 Tax=Staphylococcus gallinarum TaxID=1293 RepID=A0A3A0VPJ1_STAGA|nr:hypothetical protein [Staphylococcus gallinarum]RIP35858.1 hypothetical protein BUZ14_04180 [Staphylococcus gallinarum]
MKKWTLIILSGFVLILIGYITSIYITFSREEIYYGKVNKSKSQTVLYSKNARYITSLNKLSEWQKAKEGDILKVQYTDQKGVICYIHTVNDNKVPKDIMSKLKQ